MHADAGGDVGAELVLQFEQQPLRSLLADAGDLRELAGVLHRHRLRELGDRETGEDRQRGARADAADLHELPERSPLVVGAEAEEKVRVLPDDEMGKEHDALAGRGQVVERAHRHVDLVRDALHVEQQLRRVLLDEDSGEATDHGEGNPFGRLSHAIMLAPRGPRGARARRAAWAARRDRVPRVPRTAG